LLLLKGREKPSMRVARRTFIASTLATAAAPAVLRFARADTPQAVLKLHHSFSSVSGAHDKFLAPWARQVQAQSNGRIRIDLFPSMQLGGAPSALFDQARDGVADIVLAMPSLTPGRFPKIEAWELPFVPSRRALVSSKAIDDFGRANLTDEFREVRPICFSCSDRGVLHANRPIRTVEDMKDLRLHVQTRFAGDAVRALGATAVPMPSTQLPLAIMQHVVDGCIDPWDMMPALKLNDLLKTHTEFADVSPSSTTFALVMNKAAYDRLPKDLKAVIDANSGLTVAAMAGTMWDVQAAAVADMVAQRGDPITTLQPEAVAHWRKVVEPVTDGWLKSMKEQKADGGKLLASARTFLAKYVSEPEPQPAQGPQAEQTSEPAQPSQASQQTQSKLPSETKINTNAAPKSDSLKGDSLKPDAPSVAPAKPVASVPAAKPEVSASAAPQAPAPDKPQTSWWRSWFEAKPTAAPAKPAAIQAPTASVPASAPPSPTPSVAPGAASSPPAVTPTPPATASVASPLPAPLPAAPVASPPVTPSVPAPAAPAPVVNPAPVPVPIAPVVKPAVKALDFPL
jgi:TRAP-type C4-dicarboxylate transport system substrate-binding protein